MKTSNKPNCNQKERHQLAGSSPRTLFCTPWWLEAVAPGSWGEVVIEQDSQLLARLPYVVKKRLGFKLLTMPRLTPSLGPWLAPHEAKYVNRLSQQHELMTSLILQLPPFDYFIQHFHHSITNWLPFYWEGFNQTTRYTYVLENLKDLEAVWQEMRENIRREVRKAQKQLVVHSDASLETFLDLNEKTFRRQSQSLPYTREFVARIDHACAEHNCRRLFFAEDAQGRVHAALFIVWDEYAAYYLMGGADPDLRNSGATSLLMWEAIQFAATVTHTFDFEGSMINPIERFFRAFGAHQKPYLSITKVNSLPLKIGLDIRSWGERFRAK